MAQRGRKTTRACPDLRTVETGSHTVASRVALGKRWSACSPETIILDRRREKRDFISCADSKNLDQLENLN